MITLQNFTTTPLTVSLGSTNWTLPPALNFRLETTGPVDVGDGTNTLTISWPMGRDATATLGHAGTLQAHVGETYTPGASVIAGMVLALPMVAFIIALSCYRGVFTGGGEL